MDAEHQELIDCLDRLTFYVERGRGYAAVFDTFETLKDYINTHFKHEEAFLERIEYPELQKHKNLHQEIAAQVTELRERLLAGDDVTAELSELATHWIVTHIAESDVSYAAWLSQQADAKDKPLTSNAEYRDNFIPPR
jgi:hemerythrin